MPSKPNSVTGLITALRPWSFTSMLAPQLVTLAVLRGMLGIALPGYSRVFALLLALISVQAAANLVNSWKDFERGTDTKDSAGDRTLVDNLVSLRGLKVLTAICLLGWYTFFIWSVVATGYDRTVLGLAVLGTFLAIGYTAGPAPLKYLALGDLAVFLSFGPAVVAYSCLVLVGAVKWEAIAFTIPVALYVVAILHANNHRDIKADSCTGAKTVAILLGHSASQVYYDFLLGGAHLSALAAGCYYGCAGSLASLLVLPQSLWLSRRIRQPGCLGLQQVEETAKSAMMFGVALSSGIIILPDTRVSNFSLCLVCLGIAVSVANIRKLYAE